MSLIISTGRLHKVMKRFLSLIVFILVTMISVQTAAQPAESLASLFRGEVDSFRTENGTDIDIYSIKHGSVAMCIGGKWVYADPVDKGAEPEVDYTVLPKADYILVTHDHGDHFDKSVVETLSGSSTQVIANPAVTKALGYGRTMSNGDALDTAEGWKIEAVAAYNNTEGKLGFHPQGRDNGYVITVDGFRIYIAGDTEVIPELSQIKDIDVAFLPCNLPYTMTPEQCSEAARTVAPKVLFPYHYGETDLRRLEELLSGSGIEVRIRLYK